MNEARRKLEAGKYKRGAMRTKALHLVRSYEMARKASLPCDGIADNLQRLNKHAEQDPRFGRLSNGQIVERLGVTKTKRRVRVHEGTKHERFAMQDVVTSRIKIGGG